MSEDAGLKLLAAIEALVSEVRSLRESVDATKTLQAQRAKRAARQAAWRAKSKRSVSVDTTRSVSVASTPEVVDLDLKQRDQDQETTSKRSVSVDATPPPPLSREAWEAYSAAYRKRHGAEPVRNATTNAQMLRFVKRIGAEEAPKVAEFYVSHRQAFYVQQMHSVGLLLRDAEKLRTEWVTGRKTTATASRQEDKTQANLDGWAEMMSEEGRRALVGK